MQRYQERTYLSAIEVAQYLKMKVKDVHHLMADGKLPAEISSSGQYRFSIKDVDQLKRNEILATSQSIRMDRITDIDINGTTQRIVIANAQNMNDVEDNSIHLVVTSPPYFNTKMYSHGQMGDLGNIHTLEDWFHEISSVWNEVYRVLQPGRKFFLNIMNLPVKDGKSYRTLNLVGKSIDLCEKLGFIFKRDIIWHKTNGVRAPFGTYPYPGSILLNNMHEFILEFNKPDKLGNRKYVHLTTEQREQSKLDKDFWLSLKNSDVWLINPEKSGDGRKHIAPYPLEIPHRLIKAFSFIGETVLDPFVGAGTTLQAAANLKRHGIGYEVNPEIAITCYESLTDKVKM